MKEVITSAIENKQGSINQTAYYEYGSIDYTVLDGLAEQNPIIIVPGFTGSRTALNPFAHELNQQSDRQVIFSEQPEIKRAKLPILDHHAEALLAILYQEELADKPVDFIAISFGAMVLVRTAELAKSRQINSFKKNKGSHTIFLAPAGSNNKENIYSLGARWVKFNAADAFNRTYLDPTGEMYKAGAKNFWSHPTKSAREIIELRKKEKIYARLGDIGLKPFIFGYANDNMYPQKTIESVIKKHGESIAGYAIPIDSSGGGDASSEDKAKSRAEWAHDYRNANHADMQYHPERTVKAILQVLDR